MYFLSNNSSRIIKPIFFLCILVLPIAESKQMLTTSIGKGRSHSMRILPYEREIKPISRMQPEPIAPSSSMDSINSFDTVQSEPIASTSIMREKNQQPLLEKTKHVSFAPNIDLTSVSEQTHSERIDPSRDGVRARMQNTLRNSAAVVGGAVVSGAIGAGAAVIFNASFATTKPLTTTTAATTTTPNENFNEIMNFL